MSESGSTSQSNGTSVQDRQRQRAARGLGTSRGGDKGTTPPRRRRPALAALAVLLIVGGAALAGLLALRLDSRVPVLSVGQDIPAGTEITADMLRSTDVASEGLLIIKESDADQVIGTYASTNLNEGQLLDTTMLQEGSPFPSGAVRVGVPLTAGLVPTDLRAGDQVRMIRAGDGTSGAEPLALGLVLSVTGATEGGGLTGSDGEGGSTASILVPAAASDPIVDAAGADLLGLALVDRGLSPADAQLTVLGGGGR